MEEPVLTIRGLETVSVCSLCDGPLFQYDINSKSTFWRDLQQCPHTNSSSVVCVSGKRFIGCFS